MVKASTRLQAGTANQGFGSRLLTAPKSLNRNSPRGSRDYAHSETAGFIASEDPLKTRALTIEWGRSRLNRGLSSAVGAAWLITRGVTVKKPNGPGIQDALIDLLLLSQGIEVKSAQWLWEGCSTVRLLGSPSLKEGPARERYPTS